MPDTGHIFSEVNERKVSVRAGMSTILYVEGIFDRQSTVFHGHDGIASFTNNMFFFLL